MIFPILFVTCPNASTGELISVACGCSTKKWPTEAHWNSKSGPLSGGTDLRSFCVLAQERPSLVVQGMAF